jgi:ribosomal protein S27AE
MKTTESENNNNTCPVCGDGLTTDHKNRGFVRHLTNAECQYGNGEKDVAEQSPTVGNAPTHGQVAE